MQRYPEIHRLASAVTMTGMTKILFVCVENAGRSQMAEAFARRHGGRNVEAVSAGTVPAKKINPIVLQVMKEKGFDLSAKKPRLLNLQIAEEADVIITMGCSLEGVCPAPILRRSVDWGLPDPKGKSIQEVREIRDEIERRVLRLLATL